MRLEILISCEKRYDRLPVAKCCDEEGRRRKKKYVCRGGWGDAVQESNKRDNMNRASLQHRFRGPSASSDVGCVGVGEGCINKSLPLVTCCESCAAGNTEANSVRAAPSMTAPRQRQLGLRPPDSSGGH